MKYKKVSRRQFTEEERKEVLKSCAGICARCGKKLKLETMTVDHVVPRSKGGGNVLDNLVALCFDCNHNKANMLCYPRSYYVSVAKLPKMKRITDYVVNWLQDNLDMKYLQEYPLIFNKFVYNKTIKGMNTGRKNKIGYNPKFSIDVVEVDSNSALRYMMTFGVNDNDIRAVVPEPNHLFSVYVTKSSTTETVYSMFAVQYVNETLLISEIVSVSMQYSMEFMYAVATCFPEILYETVVAYGVRLKDKKNIECAEDILKYVYMKYGFIYIPVMPTEQTQVPDNWKTEDVFYYVVSKPEDLEDTHGALQKVKSDIVEEENNTC